ncbi:energy-coupling factor transporter ATP-binding protein EcfA2 [Aequitasia blattaphilus]|uniref:ATP-binding cassette domain-containing protein n=1 Tax=Aequitasia blattaphilus TaxID=2949332 RepID=A0ABT1EEE2_9FIRM|nr:ATP-binding cassette domain-containing protein [Aequitasia blattaphilus]MCP1103307.1 ATP-binding cassette domain-containing protein [Aequitasia blattaphilus]MCR8615947.1 ATP-binding cassette domain-containing protein [Aequitasia blattaphilus]
MIELKNVSFSYEEKQRNQDSIQNMDFYIKEGECIVFCGPSGCGKSTVLRLISGLIPSVYDGTKTGSVLVQGIPIESYTSNMTASTFGMVLQDPRSQFFMNNVLCELSFAGENLGIHKEVILNRIQTLSAQLNITHLLSQDINHLSSGEKQRVAIASAMLLSPSILLLDEPTANLDAASVKELVHLLIDLKKDGITIIISDHRLHPFLPVADRYLFIEDGLLKKEWLADEFSSLSLDAARRYGLRHKEMEQDFPNSSERNELSLENIGFYYKKALPVHVNTCLGLESGKVCFITGENGVGKTTLAKILCGLLKEKSGQVTYKNQRLSRKKRRSLSYFVMQDADYQLYTDSVGNELLLGRKATDAIKARAYKALDLFQLTHLKEKHPAALSGGEKQRLTLACAYCTDAKIIVLDEPTSGLDYHNVKRVATFIQELLSEGRMVAIITHDKVLSGLLS